MNLLTEISFVRLGLSDERLQRKFSAHIDLSSFLFHQTTSRYKSIKFFMIFLQFKNKLKSLSLYTHVYECKANNSNLITYFYQRFLFHKIFQPWKNQLNFNFFLHNFFFFFIFRLKNLTLLLLREFGRTFCAVFFFCLFHERVKNCLRHKHTQRVRVWTRQWEKSFFFFVLFRTIFHG